MHFDKSGSNLLVGGLDRHVRIFAIDGQTNSRVLDILLQDTPIYCADYTSSSELIIGGKKPFYYLYDIESGSTTKVRGGGLGGGRGSGSSRTTFDNMIVSPEQKTHGWQTIED